MKMYISEKNNDQVLIIDSETEDEAKILNKFECVQGPLTARVLHAPGYGSAYLEIRKEKT